MKCTDKELPEWFENMKEEEKKIKKWSNEQKVEALAKFIALRSREPKKSLLYGFMLDCLLDEINKKEKKMQKQQKEIEKYKYLYEKALSELVQADKKSLDKDKRISNLEYALLDMIMQFADRPHKNGCEYAISTMGLSALELAFNELDLDDPTSMKIVNAKYNKLQKQYFERKADEK